MFEKLLIWSKLTIRQRLNFLMALIIVILGWQILTLRQDLKDEQLRCAIRKGDIEKRLDFCNQNYLLYLQTSERELRELLFEVKQLKRERDEND